MLRKGLEPSSQRHTHLKRTCIPIPSPQHITIQIYRFADQLQERFVFLKGVSISSKQKI